MSESKELGRELTNKVSNIQSAPPEVYLRWQSLFEALPFEGLLRNVVQRSLLVAVGCALIAVNSEVVEAGPVLENPKQEIIDSKASESLREPASSIETCESKFLAQGYRPISNSEELRLTAFYGREYQNAVLVADIDITQAPNGQSDLLLREWHGVFEGCGHRLSGLRIQSPFSDFRRGLFTTNFGIIRNLILSDVNIALAANDEVGTLAGVNFGTIKSVRIEEANVRGRNRVGGIVGKNFGRIAYSSFSGEVAAEGANLLDIGGLVGLSHGKLTESYFMGTVTVENSSGIASNIGGLIGSVIPLNAPAATSDEVTDSFARGSIRILGVPAERVGGLLGHKVGASIVRNTYVAMQIQASGSYIRGNVGRVSASYNSAGLPVVNSFWDVQVGVGLSQTGMGGTGRTTTQLMTAATFEFPMLVNPFDPAKWILQDGAYPVLRNAR